MWRCVELLLTAAILARAEVNMEAGEEVGKETTKETTKETAKEAAKETTKEPAKDRDCKGISSQNCCSEFLSMI